MPDVDPPPAAGALLADLRRLGLLGSGEAASVRPLTGGVSSDIHLVEAAGRRFCVKRALARLKVEAVWEAPVARNAAETAWLRHVGCWLPGSVPEILAEDAAAGLFAMTYLAPADHPVWKADLLAGRIDLGFAALVGLRLAEIHAASAREPAVRGAFAHDETFERIRIDPYLRATAEAHPGLRREIGHVITAALGTRTALMHGDVSPKNILVGPRGPVFLDAECACFGDPAFDLAFCLNHLLLKGARRSADRAGYLGAFEALAAAYLRGVVWEAPAAVEARAARLLPVLFLARIDGKSPVEYLVRDDEREAVRRCAGPLIAQPVDRLSAIADAWRASP